MADKVLPDRYLTMLRTYNEMVQSAQGEEQTLREAMQQSAEYLSLQKAQQDASEAEAGFQGACRMLATFPEPDSLLPLLSQHLETCMEAADLSFELQAGLAKSKAQRAHAIAAHRLSLLTTLHSAIQRYIVRENGLEGDESINLLTGVITKAPSPDAVPINDDPRRRRR